MRPRDALCMTQTAWLASRTAQGSAGPRRIGLQMLRTRKRRRSRRVPARSARPRSRPPRRDPREMLAGLEQRHLDLVGLGLVAVGVYLGCAFYAGWDGGPVGGWLTRRSDDDRRKDRLRDAPGPGGLGRGAGDAPRSCRAGGAERGGDSRARLAAARLRGRDRRARPRAPRPSRLLRGPGSTPSTAACSARGSTGRRPPSSSGWAPRSSPVADVRQRRAAADRDHGLGACSRAPARAWRAPPAPGPASWRRPSASMASRAPTHEAMRSRSRAPRHRAAGDGDPRRRRDRRARGGRGRGAGLGGRGRRAPRPDGEPPRIVASSPTRRRWARAEQTRRTIPRLRTASRRRSPTARRWATSAARSPNRRRSTTGCRRRSCSTAARATRDPTPGTASRWPRRCSRRFAISASRPGCSGW